MINGREDLLQLDEKVKGRNYFNNVFQHGSRCKELDVVFSKLYDLYYIIGGANFNLTSAANKELSLEEYETNGEDIFRSFLRGEYLKSCILAYNSVEDYVMQIISFAYNFKEWKVSSKKKFAKMSRNIYYKDIKKTLTEKDYGNILTLITNYHDNTYIKKIRDICSKLKHGTNISFNELPSKSFVGFKVDGEYDSSWIEPEREELENLIDICWNANLVIKKYIDELYEILSVDFKLHLINE